MTQVVAEEVDVFHNRPLPSQFAVVYLDDLNHVKQRGLEEILLFFCEGFKDCNKLVRKYILEHVSNVVMYI